MGKKRRERRSSCTGLSTTQIKKVASELSHHSQIRNFFTNHVQMVWDWAHDLEHNYDVREHNLDVMEQLFRLSRINLQHDSGRVPRFKCTEGTLKELGEVVAAAHEEALAQGCREAVALALCALPCGNHFTKLEVDVRPNSGSAPFLALLADTNSCVLEELTFGKGDCFRRKAEWSMLAHLILHNTRLKLLHLNAGLEEMSELEEGGIALANSIRDNRGLRVLYIENTDAFGKERGGLALATMVRRNYTLRTLELRNVSLCSRGTEALASALLHNTKLKSLLLRGKMREEGGIALAESIQKNRHLYALSIEDTDAFGKEGGGLALAAMLRHNSTLRKIRLHNVPLCSRGAEALAKAVGANRDLRELFILGGIGPVPFGSAIAGLCDCVLETLALDVDAVTADAMMKLLTTSKPGHAGVSTASSANICHSLQKLVLHVVPLDQGNMNGMDVSAAADMIQSNQKLVSLALHHATYSSLEWANTIIPAVESNSTLKELHFENCQGVDAELAYNALIRMLSNNTTLRSIKLMDTPLSRAGKAEIVDEELRQNVQYRSTLAALPKIKVKSCRLVLCGNAFAGKTTLCNTMLRLQPGNRTRFQVPQDETGSQEDAKEKERTRGFEVNLLIDEDKLRVALWDFAGQPFYYALHDSVFPSVNGSTILLFAFSPLKDVVHTSGHLDHLTSQHLKSMQDFEDEFKYWLRFVSSNSRPRPSQPHLPSVVVVITFQDCTMELLASASTYHEVEFLEKVDALQAEFKEFVHILGKPEFLDARCETRVQLFLKRLRERFVNLVSILPPVPAICEKTRLHLEGWCSKQNNSPLMSIQDFKHIFQELCGPEIIALSHKEPEITTLSHEELEIMPLSDLERQVVALERELVALDSQFVALYLHSSGEEQLLEISTRQWKDIQKNREDLQKKREDIQKKREDIQKKREDIQKWEDIQKKQEDIRKKRRQTIKSLVDKYSHVVALYLHDTGEVIYLDGLMDFIVVNPRWLGQGVMGHLVEEFSPYDHLNRQKLTFHEKKRGFVTTQCLKNLLEASLRRVGLSPTTVTTDKLIQLLCNLHLCYARKDEYDRDGYFIPVLFAEDDKVQLIDRQLEWPSGSDDVEHHLFFGARLQCANINKTFLTPGFFPRVQALLYDAGKKKGWDEAGTKMAIHLYGVSTHGYDVLLEFNDVTFHIDVLVRSSTQDHFSSRSFVYQNFIKPIRSFCASQEGCVGVYLTEGVLRQECVKRRTSSRYRQKQCVSKEDLKRLVLSAAGHIHVHQWFVVKHHDSDLIVLEAKQEYATLLAKSTIQTIYKEGEADDVVILGTLQEIRNLTQGTRPVPNLNQVEETCYPNTWKQGKRRGLALILSMEKQRPGGAVDRGTLRALAVACGFSDVVLVDPKASELSTTITSIVEDVIEEDECFLCVINGHGGTKDGKPFILDEEKVRIMVDLVIFDPFRRSQQLRGKPKIFVINCCRGGTLYDNSDSVEADADAQQVTGSLLPHVKELSDCLLVFSTSEGCPSCRDPMSGTIFVNQLMETVMEKKEIWDVLSMMTMVNERVNEVQTTMMDPQTNTKVVVGQCCEVRHSLRKKLYWKAA